MIKVNLFSICFKHLFFGPWGLLTKGQGVVTNVDQPLLPCFTFIYPFIISGYEPNSLLYKRIRRWQWSIPVLASSTTTTLDLFDQTSRQICYDGWDPLGVQTREKTSGWLLCCGGTSGVPSYTAAIVSNWNILFCDPSFAVDGPVILQLGGKKVDSLSLPGAAYSYRSTLRRTERCDFIGAYYYTITESSILIVDSIYFNCAELAPVLNSTYLDLSHL